MISRISCNIAISDSICTEPTSIDKLSSTYFLADKTPQPQSHFNCFRVHQTCLYHYSAPAHDAIAQASRLFIARSRFLSAGKCWHQNPRFVLPLFQHGINLPACWQFIKHQRRGIFDTSVVERVVVDYHIRPAGFLRHRRWSSAHPHFCPFSCKTA